MKSDSIATFFIHLESMREGNYFESNDRSFNIEVDSNSSADFFITLVFYIFIYQDHIYLDIYLILAFILNIDYMHQWNCSPNASPIIDIIR